MQVLVEWKTGTLGALRYLYKMSNLLLQRSFDFSTPLEYELVVSARARRLSLRVEPGRGVIVTIPRRFPKRQVPAFVEKHRDWLESTMSAIDANTPELYRQWPPLSLNLQALGRQQQIVYTNRADGSGDVPDLVPHLSVASNPDHKTGVATEVALFLRQLARQVLPPRLASHAATHALTYSKVQIRGQRTVWGSYSSTGTLSLNYKLLFLPPELVDYVLLHELAHTLCMDHSPEFWRQLEKLQPGARGLDERLSQAGRDVPPWLELAR